MTNELGNHMLKNLATSGKASSKPSGVEKDLTVFGSQKPLNESRPTDKNASLNTPPNPPVIDNEYVQVKKSQYTDLKNESVFKSIFEKAAIGVALVSPAGRVIRANKAFQAYLGYTEEELNKLTFPEFTHPDDVDIDINYYNQLISDEIQDYQMDKRYITKDGKVIWVQLNVSLARDRLGEIIHAIAVVQNIEQLKKSQSLLEQRNRELELSNKELEKFAYVASHDLQEPLRTITSFIQLFLLEKRESLDKNSLEYLDIATNASIRMRGLIEDLLSYSRMGITPSPFGVVNIDALVKQVTIDISTSLEKKNAKINFENLGLVSGDSNKLYRLFKNLLVNAIKFQEDGNVPVVSIKRIDTKKRAKFQITDNGIGISSEFKESVFDIFKRLNPKDEFEGSGIGLAVAKKVVELHKGKIKIESKVNQGTTVSFDLPKC